MLFLASPQLSSGSKIAGSHGFGHFSIAVMTAVFYWHGTGRYVSD